MLEDEADPVPAQCGQRLVGQPVDADVADPYLARADAVEAQEANAGNAALVLSSYSRPEAPPTPVRSSSDFESTATESVRPTG